GGDPPGRNQGITEHAPWRKSAQRGPKETVRRDEPLRMDVQASDPDRPLSNEMAHDLIAAQFPQLGPGRVTGRYGGMDHHAVELDATWIFRFPKRGECERALLRELKLLPVVAPLLGIPVPVYQFFGAPTSDFPYSFAGYRKLAGTPAIECPPELV